MRPLLIFFFISEQQDTINDTTSELSGLPTMKNLKESHSVCFWWSISSKRYRTEDKFSRGTLSRCRFMFWYPTLTLWPRELQFVQKGNEQLHKLSVCWIWKRMKIYQLENLNVNCCWFQRVFPYKRFEEIGFNTVLLKISFCDDSELLFILHTSIFVFMF